MPFSGLETSKIPSINILVFFLRPYSPFYSLKTLMKRRHWVILAILLLILTIIARESLGAFVANHGYYDAMMKNASSR